MKQTANNALQNRMWNEFVKKAEKLPENEIDLLSNFLDKYPKIMSTIRPEHLAVIAKYRELKVIQRLIKDDANRLVEFFISLFGTNHFEKTVNTWLISYKRITKDLKLLLD